MEMGISGEELLHIDGARGRRPGWGMKGETPRAERFRFHGGDVSFVHARRRPQELDFCGVKLTIGSKGVR